MTVTEVRDRLYRIEGLRKEIGAKEDALKELLAQATHITSILSHAKVFSESGQSAPENYAVRSYELRLDMEESMDELLEELDLCFRMIDVVQDPLIRSILIDCHINLLAIDQLAEKYHYSIKQIYNIRQKGYGMIADNFRM